jgi:cyanophycinase
MASEIYYERGANFLEEFKHYGPDTVDVFYIENRSQANSDSVVSRLSQYSGFFFGGGNQNRLTKIFLDTKTLKLFHQKYEEGAVIGGTSAGAAIMSEVMITGGGEWTELKENCVEYTTGFGFLPTAIIDQHFVENNRFNRLLAMVVEHQIPGIGIDRLTAVWVKPGGEMEVMGERVVMVIRPSDSSFPEYFKEGRLTASNLKLDVYEAGQRFRID